MLFVISGPSGCGKSSLVRRILRKVKNVRFSVSHTTREPRNSEKEGRDYYFVSKAEFEAMIKKEKFLEWATIHGHYYGTSRKEVERKGTRADLVLDVDVQGARQIKAKVKKAIFIFILPPSFRELRRRLEERGEESAASIGKRLEVAKKDVRAYPQFDYIVVNDNLDQALKELEAVILSSRSCLDSRKKEILPILRTFLEE
jgi:guanylate kinase